MCSLFYVACFVAIPPTTAGYINNGSDATKTSQQEVKNNETAYHFSSAKLKLICLACNTQVVLLLTFIIVGYKFHILSYLYNSHNVITSLMVHINNEQVISPPIVLDQSMVASPQRLTTSQKVQY
jgi:hypothetical protein